ncbi:MAG: hypothetical protein EA249_08015 [Alkalibacterium sp.]|nr:MAG: hypothetical protein EA249_08015 [Alkalibacterium sp.]
MTNYFFELYEGLDQLGPGSKESTLKAASYVHLDEPLKILDIGCCTIEKIKKKYPENQEAEAVISESEYEISLFDTYSEFYSYAFFIMKKN